MLIRPALDPQSEVEGARLKIRDPDTFEFLSDDGEDKPESEYWLRRLVLDGSVERCDRARGGFYEIGAKPTPADQPEEHHEKEDAQ